MAKSYSVGVRLIFVITVILALTGSPSRAAEESGKPFVSSTWVAGTGPRAQIWVLTVRGNSVTGLVCGPCDDPRSMAPIVGGRVIDNRHIVFFIQHDLQGGLFAQYGPYRNEARVAISDSGETADFNSHMEGEAWTSHPVHQDWKLVSRKGAK